jgi:uncharacterized Zn finger protein
MAENVTEKAHRLLASDRVQIMTADENRVIARVAGDHGVYDVEWNRGAWSCTCRNYGTCSHRVAVGLVAMTPVGASV